jgi:hypothetical protein
VRAAGSVTMTAGVALAAVLELVAVAIMGSGWG